MRQRQVKSGKVQDSIEFMKYNSENDFKDVLRAIIQSKPFGDHKFYIFSFMKRVDDIMGIKKMFMQPRLTKPDPLPGTNLFRVDPSMPDDVEVMWMLPIENSFHMYREGMWLHDPFIAKCIEDYKKNPKKMSDPEPGDLSDDEIAEIYKAKCGEMIRAKEPVPVAREGHFLGALPTFLDFEGAG